MSREHVIGSLLDLLRLSDDEFERFLPDLVVWREFNRSLPKGVTPTGMIWVDDGKPGQINRVEVTDTNSGEVMTIKGPAYE